MQLRAPLCADRRRAHGGRVRAVAQTSAAECELARACVVEERDYVAQYLPWGIFLDEMAGVTNRVWYGPRDQPRKFTASLGRNPRVPLAPHDQRWTLELRETRAKLIGVQFVTLRNLSVKGSAARRVQPGRHQSVEDICGQRHRQRATDVRVDDRSMDVRWQGLECVCVGADEAVERRAPWREGHGVEQGERSEWSAVQECCPQCDCAADVVGDDSRPIQLPEIHQLDENPPLSGDGNVLPDAFLGHPEAGEVED